jgi:hypothetical protein
MHASKKRYQYGSVAHFVCQSVIILSQYHKIAITVIVWEEPEKNTSVP